MNSPHFLSVLVPVWYLAPGKLLNSSGGGNQYQFPGYTRQGSIHTVVKGGKLRTSELADVRAKLVESPAENRASLAERRDGSAGHAGESGLVEEASAVVALEQGCAVEDAAGQVAGVDAREAVGGSRVAAEANGPRICRIVNSEVYKDLWDGVLGRRRAAVPVERHALVATIYSEAAGLAGDGEEGLERLAV